MNELGQVARRFGGRTFLVTVAETPPLAGQFASVKRILSGAGLEVAHYDGVVPNPTVASIDAGARLAGDFGAQSVIGLGDGSSMDSAKAIAVAATHPGSCWDYLFYKQAPTAATLPIIAVTTTSGTGSHATQVAVITNPATRDKSAIYHSNVYPKVSIVDPELMVSLPASVTAATGFDVLCHAFEATLHPDSSPLVELFAWEALERVIGQLPKVLADGRRPRRGGSRWPWRTRWPDTASRAPESPFRTAWAWRSAACIRKWRTGSRWPSCIRRSPASPGRPRCASLPGWHGCSIRRWLHPLRTPRLPKRPRG